MDSVYAPAERREKLWARIASLLPESRLGAIIEDVSLADTPACAERLLAGNARGRVVVRLDG